MIAGIKTMEMQRDGHGGLLEYLIRRFGGQVMKLAYYHVRDWHLAEDIMQEVFLRVYRNLDRFRNGCSYYTWIYRITVNLCRDYKGSAWFRRNLPWSGQNDLSGAEERMFEAVEGGEVFKKVMDLPLKYRTVLALYYFEDIKTPEIAAILKLNESTVRARLSRGRNMLRAALEKEG